MPKPRPLTPDEARRTLAHRFSGRADRLRQLHTRFGLRSYRVFLVWTRWAGAERGEGLEAEVVKMELLPTPKVESIDAISMRLFVAGIMPQGSIRVSEVSALYTGDQLQGFARPSTAFLAAHNPPGPDSAAAVEPHGDEVAEPYSFFYEVVEDGRGDAQPWRSKFRLAATPARRAEDLQWQLVLERISEDRDRRAMSRAGPDED